MRPTPATKKKGPALIQRPGVKPAAMIGTAPKIAPTFLTIERSGYDILASTRPLWNGTPQQIQQLSQLTYQNGEPIISTKREDVMMEVLGMLVNQPFDEVMEFLANTPNPGFVLWEQSSLDEGRTKLAREITIQQAEEVGVKGVGRCRYCNSNELVFATKQLRSGDEPATIFVRCVLCTKQWRQ